MQNKDLSQKIMDSIKEHNIEPIPKTLFILKYYLFWFLGLVCVVIGGVSFGIILVVIKNHDIELNDILYKNKFNGILLSLPYLWILCFGIFIWLSEFQIRKTKYGYVYPFWILSSIVLLLSCVFGIVFYYFGIAEHLDNNFTKKMYLYRFVGNPEYAQVGIENGFLIGKVIFVDKNYFKLEDIFENKWNVEYDFSDNLTKEMKVRVVGYKINKDIFKAIEVRPIQNNFRMRFPIKNKQKAHQFMRELHQNKEKRFR